MDSAWDNRQLRTPKRWVFDRARITIGCVAAIGLLGILWHGSMALASNREPIEAWARSQARKEFIPEQTRNMELPLEAWARSQARKDWDEARAVVLQVQGADTAVRPYRLNPKRHQKLPTEGSFRSAGASWHPKLIPLPGRPPSAASDGFGHRIGRPGRIASIGYRNAGGHWLHIIWDLPGSPPARQIVDIQVI